MKHENCYTADNCAVETTYVGRDLLFPLKVSKTTVNNPIRVV